jgi:hypothetical protein
MHAHVTHAIVSIHAINLGINYKSYYYYYYYLLLYILLFIDLHENYTVDP